MLVHGRSQASATAAAEDVLRHGDAEAVWGDLGSFAQVRELAGQVRDKTDAIDVLVNNAGVFVHERTMTADGHETTLQVNHLSMQLLTVELLPQVCAARAARVLTVSSVAHFRGTVDFDDLEHHKDYWHGRLQDSKLYNVLFAQELAERLKCEAATSNVLHPGTISTKLLAAGFPSAEGASLADGDDTRLPGDLARGGKRHRCLLRRQAPRAHAGSPKNAQPAGAAAPVGSERRDAVGAAPLE